MVSKTSLKLVLVWSMVFAVLAKPEIAVPVVNTVPVVAAEATPTGMAHLPAHIGTAVSKTVHYAETPMVTGYTSTIYKPDLRAFDTPFRFNPQQRYLRPVKTIIPKLTPIEFSVKEVEVHPPILPEIRIANVAPPYYPSAFAPLIR